MNLPNLVDELTNKGFKVAINPDHKSIVISLDTRKVNIMEVEYATSFRVDTSRMSRTREGVRVTE